MASVLSLLVGVIFFLSFYSIRSNSAQLMRFRRRDRSDVAEFDVPTLEKTQSNHLIDQPRELAKNLGERLETQIGRGYEMLGHKISDLGIQLEENKDDLGQKANDLYTGPLADETADAYENVQYGYGRMGDGLSSVLNWLGVNVIVLGHQMSSMLRSGFHFIGDFFGNSVDQTEHLVGESLLKTGEKVHVAAIDLESNSHQDSENIRSRFLKTVPDFHRVLGKLGHKLHTFGVDTEAVGKVMEQHKVIETLKEVTQE